MGAPPKILIVDDKQLNRRLLQRYLEEAGYTQISQAASGEEALVRVEEVKPDLVLLDIVMPGLDGFEVCRRLKSREETMFIPVIMVTALHDRAAKLKCLEMGADDFLSKPVDPMELKARVRSLLRLRRYYQQLKELNENLLANIKTAQRIQRALLPREYPSPANLRFNTFYQPAELLGGDYFNIFSLGGDVVCLYLADVSGHQLDAAMLTVFIRETLAGYFRKLSFGEGVGPFSPRRCLLALEEAFREEDFPPEIFITIFLAFYHSKERTLTYSAAGFAQPVFLYGGAGGLRELVCYGSPIMSLGEGKDFREQAVQLSAEEGLFLYTDGLTEQKNKDGEQFGEGRLRALLKGMDRTKASQLVPSLVQMLRDFAGADSFSDDVTLINMFVAEEGQQKGGELNDDA